MMRRPDENLEYNRNDIAPDDTIDRDRDGTRTGGQKSRRGVLSARRDDFGRAGGVRAALLRVPDLRRRRPFRISVYRGNEAGPRGRSTPEPRGANSGVESVG